MLVLVGLVVVLPPLLLVVVVIVLVLMRRLSPGWVPSSQSASLHAKHKPTNG